MAENNFIDYVKLYCKSGAGGPGKVAWRREKFAAHGGPAGGDGGQGGNVVLKGNAQQWTLLDLKYRKFLKAQHGEPGGQSNKAGKGAPHLILEAPVGTVAKDAETGEVIGEITAHGEELILVPGGRGGLGNWHFRTATNQAPDYAQPGEPSQERVIILELKLLADVGLVGLPNAGKSTLLSTISAAKPEIADYPFTTLVPNLGLVRYRAQGSFVMADIPGIIEGAAQGKGLGLRFLRHIERNSVLLFLIPMVWPDADGLTSPNDIAAEYKLLLHELEQYDAWLLHKPRVIAATKVDLATDKQLKALKKLKLDAPILPISSANGAGIDALLDALWVQLTAENVPLIPPPA